MEKSYRRRAVALQEIKDRLDVWDLLGYGEWDELVSPEDKNLWFGIVVRDPEVNEGVLVTTYAESKSDAKKDIGAKGGKIIWVFNIGSLKETARSYYRRR